MVSRSRWRSSGTAGLSSTSSIFNKSPEVQASRITFTESCSFISVPTVYIDLTTPRDWTRTDTMVTPVPPDAAHRRTAAAYRERTGHQPYKRADPYVAFDSGV